jgi:23S rRNA (adenine2030-N6)-methyltransferase
MRFGGVFVVATARDPVTALVMLSYQHIYHAGNLADVHKHMLLAGTLSYLTRKDKPLTYIETHAGRGLYDLASDAARKTAEAASGIERIGPALCVDGPYARCLDKVRAMHGASAYPGSPLLAALLLRASDTIHLAELHPGEYAALSTAMAAYPVRCHHRNGFELAHTLCPPTPRRGLLFIDPSWEIKSDYDEIPTHIAKIMRAWNVGIIALWYPLLRTGAHAPMLRRLMAAHPSALRHEVRFPPAHKDHGMVGSGMFFVNPPYGLDQSAKAASELFTEWFPQEQRDLT